MAEVDQPGTRASNPDAPDADAERSRAPWEFKVLLLFVAVLGLEWFLRRSWGMV